MSTRPLHIRNQCFSVCFLAVFCTASLLLAQTVAPAPATSGVGDAPRVTQGHPCTLWDEEDIAAYKTALGTDPGFKAAFEKLRVWGNKRVTEPLGVPAHRLESDGTWTFPGFKRGYQDGSGKWNWEWNFNGTLQQRTADVSNLGMLYALTGDEKYAAFARQILLSLADTYGHGKGSTVPDPHGFDHFEAYGFDGGDAGMFLAKACHGYDLIYNLSSLSTEDRTHIEGDLIRPLAEHLKKASYMFTSHGRWGMVCLYGVFISGVVLDDQTLVRSTLYGLGGTKGKVTGGFMDCFKPACLRSGAVWGANSKIEEQMAAVCVLTTVAEVMWHRGINLYTYQDRALKQPFDAALAGVTDGQIARLLNLPGISAYPYAFRRYQDARYLPLLRELKPDFALAIGEHLPSLPAEDVSAATPALGVARSEKPKYLIFWSEPERAGELAERIGMKGEGEARLLGFGVPNATYEIEAQLPNRIRSAFAAAREHDLAVMLHFDFHLHWKSRPDLWNWFDPAKPGYDPNNQYNVEWHGWNGPPNKVRYLNHGVLERLPPNMCLTSKKVRAEITRIVSRVIGPVLREEMAKLQAEGKQALFAGVLVGLEPSIDDYSQPGPDQMKMMQEDGVPAGPLGYRALLDRCFSADHPPADFRAALAKIIQETVAFWCEQFVQAGIPAEKLYTHVAAPAPIEAMNAPIWTAFNQYSRPGWTTYAVEVLGQGFKPLYDELELHGNPAWAGVEANAGMPGSVVDWETYLAWHYNHGCVLVGVNMGATGEDLPRRLRESAFSQEAITAYRKFLKGQPLVERPLSRDIPQVRIQAKMQRVRAGIERWQRSGKDPSAVGKIMEGAQPLANAGRLEELEKLVDQALQMLGETAQTPEIYPRK